ncbi:MAG: M48 family metallopeptidase [Candidatus Buchananbacteria bacterium]|nr:M48 family metallopeptidase [Candidatus Buchananbacteria bacterium]
MKRDIVLAGREIRYTHHKTRRAKRLIITVRHDASVLVTTPRYYPLKFVEQSLHEKSGWIMRQVEHFKQLPKSVLHSVDLSEYRQYRRAAKDLVEQLVKQFNQLYNFSFNKISVRRQTTRWASCSAKGNLNFNYKIIFLPTSLAEYIVVHELCHLQEMNHSQKFWRLVAFGIPDYRSRRQQLRNINTFSSQ